VAARLRERFGVDVQAMSADDGLVLRLPDLDLLSGDPFEAAFGADPAGGGAGGFPGGSAADAPDVVEGLLVDPEDVEALVTAELGGSALFASRFRECAARALLLPRRRPDRRTPLWQQRQRAAQLLEVASRYPSFPVVLETVRECLQDVFDVPALAELMRELRSGAVSVVQVTTDQPSPFARGLLFGYVAQFLYEGDTPLAEKRAAALSLDPTLLAELLGRGDGASLADLLDPEALVRTQAELQRLAEGRRCRDAEDVADLLRVLGPQSLPDVAERSLEGTAAGEPVVAGWLAELEAGRRVIAVRIAGEVRWAAVEDAGRLRDALGVPLPVGVPEAFTAPVPDPVGDLVVRWARTHAPFTAATLAARLGLGVAVVTDALRRLERTGRLVSGDLLPQEVRAALDGAPGAGTTGSVPDWCDAEVLRLLRRRSLAALRAEVEPVPARDLALHLPAWQGVAATGSGARLRGVDGVLRVVEQLAGAVLPASALESLVLPVRVERYAPALLDELTAAGEVLWCGHGSLPGDDGWVSLHLADAVGPTGHLTLPGPDAELELTDDHRAVLTALDGGGAYFFRRLADLVTASGAALDDAALTAALWDLVWAGRVSNDTLAPLRARLAGGRTAHRGARAAQGPRARYGRGRSGSLGRAGGGLGVPGRAAASAPAAAAGRWSLLPEVERDATVRATATAEVLLDRYGVVTRGSVVAERLPGGFAGVYRVLAAMEEAGRVRRGYFVEGLGASQFASTGAVDRLRAVARPLAGTGAGDWAPTRVDGARDGTGRGGAGGREQADRPRTVVLAAADPANPYGAALPWPERPTGDTEGGSGAAGHRPGRKAGALVVLLDGDLVLYVERGGRTLLSFADDPAVLQAGADALALAVRDGALGRLTVQRADGEGVLTPGGSPLSGALEAAGFTATPRGLRMRR
jgi:ATP-dependent Lhr-like helicase